MDERLENEYPDVVRHIIRFTSVGAEHPRLVRYRYSKRLCHRSARVGAITSERLSSERRRIRIS